MSTLIRDGPVVAVALQLPSVLGDSSVQGIALIDTGASRSCVDEQVVLSLGARRVGYVTTGSAAGRVRLSAFDLRVLVPPIERSVDLDEVPGVDLHGWRAVLYGASQPVIAVVGRDILAHCLFTYDGRNAAYVLSSH